jgi:tRNA-dihydrouridine synthase
MSSFWQTLPKPFTVLAPLDGVTDVVFRQIVTEVGKPDVLFTEFTPVDGLLSSGKTRVEKNLLYTKEQTPVVAQIWGTDPKHFYEVAKDLRKRNFAGIDINMGCPIRTIIKDGACSALIKNPTLTAEIIQATKEGAGDMPVSVKTRIGFEKQTISEWIGMLLSQKLAALTVHLRTVRELSQVPAHWDLMPEIVSLRDKLAPETILIGNGDIRTREEIQQKFTDFGCEGFMVGRGIFANPWLFNSSVTLESVGIEERIDLYSKHIALYFKTFGDERNFANLKKFAKTYISNFPDAGSLREKLMEAKQIADLQVVLKEYKTHLVSTQ